VKLSAIQSRQKSIETSTFTRNSLTKRLRTGIPDLHTFGATTKSTTLEELTSLTDFVDSLEKIQFPSQMVSILTDRRLQHLFLFKAGEVERRRLDYWLSVALVEGLEDRQLSSLLRVCVQFVEFTKECPASLEGFLRTYLKNWDGIQNRESVFDLLVSVVPTDFEGTARSRVLTVEYRKEIMLPLEALMEKGDIRYFTSLLRFYTLLFSRWATVFGKNFLVGSTPSPLYFISRRD